MNLYMTGIDFAHASIAQREPVSLVRGQVQALLPRIAAQRDVSGCVLLATCNRTELYVHTSGAAADPLALLCGVLGMDEAALRPLSVSRTDEEAVRHLLTVAAGLESQIFGDGQILTQTREAAALARKTGTTDAVLDSLFRCAVTAGKRVRTEVRLTRVPSSAAEEGVRRAAAFLGPLAGRRAVVVGNGEMGRLAAAALRAQGAAVTVTLRTYRHGETVVPAGCRAHPYADRYAALEGAALAFSATVSPHYTITADKIASLRRPPSLIVDLAMPRDVEQTVAQDGRVTVWNLDDLGELPDESAGARKAAQRLLDEAQADFAAWYAYRQALPVIAQVKDAAVSRVRYDHDFGALYEARDADGLIELAVGKTVDLLLGGMKDAVSAQRLSACLAHIKRRSGG